MKKRSDKQEVERRISVALTAIQETLGEADSSVALYISHHLEELEGVYWKTHAGTSQPDAREILALLELRSHWSAADEDGLDTFDFTLPGNVTDYVISVKFDDNGEVEDVDMES